MGTLHVFNHPLIQHKLSILRDKNTSVKEFRELISEIASLMCFEATRDMPTEEVEVETPVATAKTRRLAGKKMAIIPILRAGLGMVDGIIQLVPGCKVGHIGLYRDPVTLEPVEYYCKLPNDIAEREIIVLDPMLATGGSASAAIGFIKAHATGGSASAAIGFIKAHGGQHIRLMCIIGAPQGADKVLSDHPDVDIYVAAMDSHLNDHGYIVPGLGDAGDRIFGTK